MPLRAVVLALLLATACAAPTAHAANPVLPGDYPDPSVTRFGDVYVATATSDRWEPVFPVLVSRDLVRWRQAGSVFARAPRWAEGHRFWAPEITVAGGRLVVVFAGLRRTGQWCIGAASATTPEGPWRDLGRVHCPSQGAIDPALAQDADGTWHLLYKGKGVGRGLHAAPVDVATMDLLGPSRPLLRPTRGDAGVTEGPAVLRRGEHFYLLFSRGTCCRPPCSYEEWVARAPSLLGPYERLGRPVLRSSRDWRCPGHGSPVELGDGRVALLHHAYRAQDRRNRRRQGLLTALDFGEDGWPGAPDGPGGLGPLGDLVASAATAQQALDAAPSVVVDGFGGSRLAPAWQWVSHRRPTRARVAGGRLHVRCGPEAMVTRQVAQDALDVAVTLGRPARRAQAASLLVRARDGLLRGVELRDGRLRAVRRRGGTLLFEGPPVAVDRRRPQRVRLTLAADGGLTAWVRQGAFWVAVPAGRAGTGVAPTRIALACRGKGSAHFRSLRIASDAGRLEVPAAR